MEPFGIGVAGMGIAGLSTLGAFGLAFRSRRRRLRAGAAAVPEATSAPRSAAERLEALGAAQAELGMRLDALAERAGAPEERLQAMAGQLLGLIRDKNATLETALAGLDQLRARMRTLEQIGAPAEARALHDGLVERLDALARAQAAAEAGTEARLAALAAAGPGESAALAERLASIEESRSAGIEATRARLAPIEARLAAAEKAQETARDAGQEALRRIEARQESLAAEAAAARTALAALRAEAGGVQALGERLAQGMAQKEALAERLTAIEAGLAARDPAPALDRLAERLTALETAENPFAEVSEQLTRLYAQKDATVETLLARLAPLEARLAEIDPASALDRFSERLEAVQGRVASLEGVENPFAEVSEQLTRLYAQKDATVETLLARLAPLEARLAEIDPASALDRFAERLEAVQGRVASLEGVENPFAEVSEQLTRLYAQKDATVETLLARLAPLEARLAEIDPASALDRFAERLEAVQGRVATLEGVENPFAEVSEQLTRLYAQKDATVETLLARLAPLEARLAEIDPASALDRFAERLEAVQGRVATLEGVENPFAEVSEQLTRLYAQKDATVETLLARLAPLEARLAEIDPASALDRFSERLEAVQGRVATLEGAENPFAEVSEQLTRLYAQKDATVETLLARLAPLEARLAEIDPASALDRFAERLEAVQGRVATLEGAENPFAEVSEQLTRLYAQKDATVATLLARLAPLEARLAEIEAAIRPQPAEEARAGEARADLDGLKLRVEALHWAQGETAAGLAALRAAAEAPHAAPHDATAFDAVADRLARLLAEKDARLAAVLERIAPLEARLAAVEGAGAGLLGDRIAALEAGLPRVAQAVSPAAAAAAELEAIWAMPGIVSLHRT